MAVQTNSKNDPAPEIGQKNTVNVSGNENILIIQSVKPKSSFWETGWTKIVR